MKDWGLGSLKGEDLQRSSDVFFIGPSQVLTRCERLGFGFLSKVRLSKGRRMCFYWALTGAIKV